MRKLLCLLVVFTGCITSAIAQQKHIEGVVKDAGTHDNLPFATIRVKSPAGATSSSMADNKGQFKIDAQPGATVMISFTGYNTVAMIVKENDSTHWNIMLQNANAALSEVVVIGYGKERRKDLTSAVATVSGKEIVEMPSTNLASALASRTPGLEVHANSTQPGAGVSVNIRGLNSISQLQGPLYIVDGVALVGDIRNVNPADIESVEILKDAAAAGIYGSRAAEGVVLITTKKPKAGQTSVNFDMYAGIQVNNPAYKMLGAKDYYQLKRTAFTNADPVSFPPNADTTDGKIFNQYEMKSIANGFQSYNWQNAIAHNNAPIQNYNISLANGTGSNRVYFSGNYMDQQGILINTGYKKYAGYLADESQIRSFLKIGGSVNFTHDQTRNAMPGEFQQSLTQSPLMPPYDSTNQPLIIIDNSTGVSTIINPLTTALYATNMYTTNRTNANLYLELTPFKNFTLRSSIGADIYQAEADTYWPRNTGGGFATNGSGEIYNTRSTDVLWENTANYYLTKGKHELNVLGGFTFERHENFATDMQGQYFPTDLLSFKNMGSAGVKVQDNSNYDGWSVRSLLARAIYKFKGRYILNVTARQDGSSRFGPDNKFGFFPTVSGAWRVVDEPFIGYKLKTVLSDFKLRASYGLVGNQNLPYDAIYTRFNQAQYPFNGSSVTSGYTIGGTAGNTSLEWERQHQLNAGTDIAVLNNRISLSVDVYRKNISALLMPLTLAPSSGFYNEQVNVAAMQTKGIDVMLKATPIETKRFAWQTSLNWSKYQSRITRLFPGRDSISLSLRVGLPPSGTYVNYVYDGLYQKGDDFKLNPNGKPGDIRIKDVNGDGKITPQDEVVVGSSIPKGWGSWWNYFRLGRFNLVVYSTYQYGHQLNNLTYTNLTYYNAGFGNTANVTVEGGKYWTPENPNTNIPRPDAFGTSLRTLPGGTGQGSSYSIQKAAYIKIQHITLGYDVDGNVLKRMHMNSLNVYAQVLNPFLFTGYKGVDPDVSGGNSSNELYPRYRTFLLGLKLGL